MTILEWPLSSLVTRQKTKGNLVIQLAVAIFDGFHGLEEVVPFCPSVRRFQMFSYLWRSLLVAL